MAAPRATSKKVEGLESITYYRRATISLLEHVPFAVLYGLALYQCHVTFGVPYISALAEAERMFNDDGSEINVPCNPLPSPYVPSFMSRLFLVSVLLLHGLMALMQRWSINFKCFIKFKVVPLKEATHAKVVPEAHKGKTMLVPLTRMGNGVLSFNFQKHKYAYEESEDDPQPRFRKIAAPITLPRKHYAKARGTRESSVRSLLDRFGLNEFEISVPSYQELYIEGLLSPFSVFQFFCILLWCLDEYWHYPLFTLFMMLVFEGTVVFSRRKSIDSLRGMNNAPRQLFVRRGGNWSLVSALRLVPGDIISVVKGPDSNNIVPCDCLILHGSSIVNEASLTGESVPQMKEAMPCDKDSENTPLDINGAEKVHILFGGTKILQHSGRLDAGLLDVSETNEQDEDKDEEGLSSRSPLAATPDGGCLCYVLRTGFDSSQGNMVRMIEFSSEKVSSNTLESLLLVLFLLMFALAASGYVLKRGLEDKREQFDLLLHCIQIVTNVVPPELNMQLALAVNASLIALIRLHVFCIEPFRIPMAGKVDVCLFDKTGTLTSDELVTAGVVNAPSAAHHSSSPLKMELPDKSNFSVGMVVAGCHSLVQVDGQVIGDPLESAALKSVRWTFNSETNTSHPIDHPSSGSVKILTRHHFSSKLQRMSVVARVNDHGASHLMALVKGSPEVIQSLLRGDAPAWFTHTYTSLASQGMRVIALAKRTIRNMSETEACEQARSWVEHDLEFVGFLAFSCLVRKDSAAIIEELKASSHRVGMITGDAMLTAIHVAGDVGITSFDKQKILILKHVELTDHLEWITASDLKFFASFSDKGIDGLVKQGYDLCLTGEMLTMATDRFPSFWNFMQHIRVFARMTPDKKERVLIALKDSKFHTVMCGDGSNDVGALKQAHVGIALLSGFGSSNVDKPAAPVPESNEIKPKEEKKPLTAEEIKQKRAEQAKQMQEEFQKNYQDRVARGESWAFFKELKATMEKNKQKAIEMNKKAGNVGSFTESAAALATEDDGTVPMVKLGDASIASAFTSKKPSIAAAVDIIRQGRCTLVTTLQMYQILALNCLISSFSLSVLYLDGVKYGDRQMTSMHLLMTISFIAISRSQPLPKLSSVRPFSSIFHPALFISLVGQFAIHLACMVYTLHITKPYLPANFQPSFKGNFEPNLINSAVFLVTCVQQVSVFVVNYKGPPFMEGMSQNSFLLYPLGLCAIGAFVAASNTLPIFNQWLQLEKYPSDSFQQTLFLILLVDVLGTLIFDRLMVAIFAPDIFLASIKSVSSKGIKQVLKIFLICFFIFYLVIGGVDEETLKEMEKQGVV